MAQTMTTLATVPPVDPAVPMTMPVRRRRDHLREIANGGPSTEGIPARVLTAIAAREDAAERLIGWVQLGLLSAFSILYLLSPRAEGTSGQNFVPLILGAYFLFTTLRLGLSYRLRLPVWFLFLSIVVDVALLCGLIFSFHIQYAQPAAFYLKAPTMIYLVLFIAMRALRFDPRFVLMAGLTSVVGWMLMVSYALTTDMGEMRITRNYVSYLTSNSILIGAEIDKVLVLLGVTFVLGFALLRARQVMFDSILSHSAADDLRQFFDPKVADRITEAEELPGAGRSETRHAAILFFDVRGFTSTAETLPPQTVMRMLALYQEAALPVIEAHGGRIDKFMGDGILATFGAVQDSESFAADALRAAQDLIAALDGRAAEFSALGWPGSFRTGAGVACGTVTVGVVGAQGRLEFTVIGNAVNLASKLENANKAQDSRALTDRASFEMAVAQGFDPTLAEIRPGVQITGIARPVDLVVLA